MPPRIMDAICVHVRAHILSHHILLGLLNGLPGLVLMPVVYAWVQKQAIR
ncbi:MAG: hypothetical protein AAFZ92_09160 [Pseudomonadota bacterium]